MEDFPLLSLTEVARRLGVTRRTVERFKERGQLPCVKIGGSVRVLPSDLEEYLRRARTGPAAPPSRRSSSGRGSPSPPSPPPHFDGIA